MSLNYEFSFEIKPGKPVYIQLPDALNRGEILTASILEVYKPSRLFFHLKRRGGHVHAMRIHTKNVYFSRFDIRDFFGNVTRAKIIRALVNIGWNRKEAFEAAWDSVVVRDGRAVLPFGFHQSPLLATLVLEQSALGVLLAEIAGHGLTVSIYMDDMLISSNDHAKLTAASERIEEVAISAGFPLAVEKSAVALDSADIFNCRVGQDEIRFLDHRMAKFLADHGVASEAGREAIERYIHAVSDHEYETFLESLANPKQVFDENANARWFELQS